MKTYAPEGGPEGHRPIVQRNGFPQKKQKRLSAFTIVPQAGHRFFEATCAAGVAGALGEGGATAGTLGGRTNSIGGGALAARGCAAAGVEGGCVGRADST